MDLLAWQKGISSLGKNDKRGNNQKVGLKKRKLEALEKERIKLAFQDSPKRESQLGTFKEGTSKEENNVEKGRDQPPMLLIQHWFWYTREQMEGINGTPETLYGTIKG